MKRHFGSCPVSAIASLCLCAFAAAPPDFAVAGVVTGDILVPGTAISIYGHNMNGPTSVFIGGNAAKLLYV